MQGAVIRMGGDAALSEAIAEGIVRAENEALKEKIAQLTVENEKLRTELELLRWHRARENEEKLYRFAEKSKEARRCPIWARFMLAVMSFVQMLR